MTDPAGPADVRVQRAIGGDDLSVFEDMFDHAACALVATTPDGRIVRSNHLLSEWLGIERGALVGRRFSELLNIAGRIYYETHFAPLLRLQGRFNEVALDLVHAAGTTVPVLVNAVERRDADGRPFAIWLAVFSAVDRRRYERDLLSAREALRELTANQEARIEAAVSNRLELEGTLRQSQKMEVVGQLTAGLAHDFNNILVSVSGAFDLMERRIEQGRSDEVAKYIPAGKEAVRRAISLAARLLAFSRKQETLPGPVTVDPVVTGMEDLVRRTVGSRVGVRFDLAARAAKATVDVNQLESALLNLCLNARDAMPHGGTLTIETAIRAIGEDDARALDVPPGSYVVLGVTDTGTGMPEEVASRVLEPFFTTKPEGQGTGLGLAMVFEFTRQALGGLRIDSALGRGTTISLFLPSVVDSSSDVDP